MESPAPITALPSEIFLAIVGHLDIVSKIRLRRVNKKWNSILREGHLWEKIKLTEEEHLHWYRWASSEPSTSRWIFFGSFDLPKNLVKAGIFQHVKCLILEGDYDVSDEQNCFWTWGIVMQTMNTIHEVKQTGDGNFEKLECIKVRRAVIALKDLLVEDFPNALKCRMTIEEGSLMVEYFGIGDEWELMFDIPESRSFDLSGRITTLNTGSSGTHGLAQVVGSEDGDADTYRMIPIELAEFVAERCNAVTADTLAKLGDVYSELLRGRDGMVIRPELAQLFSEIASSYDGYDPSRKHWEQVKNYDFNSLGSWVKYCLLHFARPKNCYCEPSVYSVHEVVHKDL